MTGSLDWSHAQHRYGGISIGPVHQSEMIISCIHQT